MTFTSNTNTMDALLVAFNGKEITTLHDESSLSLTWLTRRLIELIEENIYCYKLGTWNIRNRLNKILIDDERAERTLLNIRVGRKQIARYMFPQLCDTDKIALLEQLKRQVASHQFDDKFSAFLESELQKTAERRAQRRHKRNENQSFVQADSQMY